MTNPNRIRLPVAEEETTAQNPAEQLRRDSQSRLPNLPQPTPAPPTYNPLAAGQRRMAAIEESIIDAPSPPLPTGHVGGALPQTAAQAALAAAQAALEPNVIPNMLPPPPIPEAAATPVAPPPRRGPARRRPTAPTSRNRLPGLRSTCTCRWCRTLSGSLWTRKLRGA
jgi:hypothetical protein